MSPVAIALDALLAGLLIVALVVGMRLNKRLKVLRDTQAGFAQAVLELNQAAGRAEAGLAALRAASEEAHDSLLTRIDTARNLSTKLERLIAQAERTALTAPLGRDVPGDDRGGRTSSLRPEPLAASSRASLDALAALLTQRAAAAAPSPPIRERASEAPPLRRARPALDDDLFDDGAPGDDLGPLSPARTSPVSSSAAGGRTARARGDRL